KFPLIVLVVCYASLVEVSQDFLVNCPELRISDSYTSSIREFRRSGLLISDDYSNEPGSVVHFKSCDWHLETLVGPSAIVCSSLGQWNPSVPKCVYSSKGETKDGEMITKTLRG
ncbi:MAG: hypothetical protein MHMPM18_004514, partial [Marteilia pararefringens]